MSKNVFFEYFRTFLLSILGAFLFVLILSGIISRQVHSEQQAAKTQDDAIDKAFIGVLIDKNKYLESQYPQDYRYNLKLGELYEISKDYKNAELEYKKAMSKAPYYEYEPKYKLTLLYVSLNRMDEAENSVLSMEERPNKRVIEYKADIYTKLGDKYYSQADYDDAAVDYQKALFYYQTIRSPEADAIKGSIASSYVYLADEKVNKMQIADAIDYLQTAQSIIDAPIIKYKLALLYIKDNPELSYKYFEEVFQAEPEIINYDEYYKFLIYMNEKAIDAGDIADANLYFYRAEKIKEFYRTNILSVNDVVINYEKGKITLNKWTKKYKVNFQFTLKNISRSNIDSLFLEIAFKDKDKIVDSYTKQFIDKKEILGVGIESPIINIKTIVPQRKGDVFPKKLTAEVYVAKTEKAYKLLLDSFEIVEAPRTRHYNAFVVKFRLFLNKIFKMLPPILVH